jgi:hypothetical protein
VKIAGPFTIGAANFVTEATREPAESSAIRHWENEAKTTSIQGAARIPLPLGPTRLAYIQLPEDWEPKELKKLIKILQIALGDDSEGT